MEIVLENAIDEFYKKPSLEMVYYEAVSNSIYAGAKNINININIDSYDKPETLNIRIEDDGEGFLDNNFYKFTRLLAKEDKNHKGLGRLVFLKYFQRVDISSIYDNKERTFIFDMNFKESSTIKDINNVKENKTTLFFSDYKLDRIKSYDYLKPIYIKEQLTLKFFPLLYSLKQQNKELIITINIETNNPNSEHNFYNDSQKINSNLLPDLETFDFPLEGSMFDRLTLKYSIINDNSLDKSILTALCVDERTIPIEIIKKDGLPIGYKIIFILFSDYFIGKVDCSRQELTLEPNELENIKRLYKENVSNILSERIPKIVERNKEVKTSLIDRYPHLQGYFDENSVGLIDRNIALEIAQKRFIKAQQEILESESLTEEQYEKSLEMSSRTLTEYILYRNKIINKLKQIDIDNNESDIHDIIVPKRKIFRNSSFINDLYSNNAWLLDDKFMSYLTILSDQKMSDIIKEISFEDEKDDTKPDITLIFSRDPEQNEKVDVVIVELKKLGLEITKREVLISQLRQRARKLSEYFPHKIQRIWFYGIIDIDNDLRLSLKGQGYAELFSKGTVLYNEEKFYNKKDENVETHFGLFILNYNSLIKDAESRNSTFLQILKEGLKKQD